jgi:hypothetical protein
MRFSDSEKEQLNNVLSNAEKASLNALSSMEDFWKVVGTDNKDLIEKILRINPFDYGFRGEEIIDEPIPYDAVAIDNSQYAEAGEYAIQPNAYLPIPVFNAFSKMNQEFTKIYPSRKLLVGSGYRSPAFQIVILIYILVKVYDFDIQKTLKRVAMPKYSDHSLVSKTPVDIMNIDGEPTDINPDGFKNSVEYQWLKKYANNFWFYEAYPPNNPDGIMWEPWHWQYLPK